MFSLNVPYHPLISSIRIHSPSYFFQKDSFFINSSVDFLLILYPSLYICTLLSYDKTLLCYLTMYVKFLIIILCSHSTPFPHLLTLSSVFLKVKIVGCPPRQEKLIGLFRVTPLTL